MSYFDIHMLCFLLCHHFPPLFFSIFLVGLMPFSVTIYRKRKSSYLQPLRRIAELQKLLEELSKKKKKG